MKSTKKPHVNLAIFASGTGSNADKICTYFRDHPEIKVKLIISNRVGAGVLDVASMHDIDTLVFPKSAWSEKDNIMPALRARKISHIVLAGFLLLLPPWFIREFKGRIINIHPALLPKYGGKGMYGHYVHEKVKTSGETISGITIHEVNEKYDEGRIILQESVKLDPLDSAAIIGKKVLELEHYYYPRTIEKWVNE